MLTKNLALNTITTQLFSEQGDSPRGHFGTINIGISFVTGLLNLPRQPLDPLLLLVRIRSQDQHLLGKVWIVMQLARSNPFSLVSFQVVSVNLYPTSWTEQVIGIITLV